MNLKKLLPYLLALIILAGCTTSKQKAYQMRMAQQIAVIDQHYYSTNVDSLIADYSKYPEQRQRIYGYLFGDIDYSKYSYDKITGFAKSSNDPKLKEAFSGIVSKREDDIIDTLLTKDLEYFGSYYRQNKSQHIFLDNFITSDILGNTDTLDYQEIKYYEYCFTQTPYCAKLSARRDVLKAGLEWQIRNDMSEIKKEEDKTVDYFKYSLETEMYDYLYGQAELVVNEFLNYNLGGMTEEDKQDLLVYLIQEKISQDTVNSIYQSVLLQYLENINESRLTIIDNLTYNGLMLKQNEIENGSFSTFDGSNIEVKKLGGSYDFSDILIGGGVAIGGTLVAALLTGAVTGTAVGGPVGTIIGSVVGVGSFFLGPIIAKIHHDKNPHKQEDKFKDAFVSEIDKYYEQIINASVSQYRNYLQTSQEKFLKLYYELY